MESIHSADVDECTYMMPCDKNAKCSNSDGSFSCACNPGYIGNGKTCTQSSKPIVEGNSIRDIFLIVLQMMTAVQKFAINIA